MSDWSTKQKVLFGVGVYLAITIALLLIFGNDGKNEEFKPQDEFKLEAWIPIHLGGIDFSINKAVLYLRARERRDDLGDDLHRAADADEAEPRPDRGRGRLRPDRRTTSPAATSRVLRDPLVPVHRHRCSSSSRSRTCSATCRCPTNSHETVDIFGLAFPSFAIYAATANISFRSCSPWWSGSRYHVEGIRAKGGSAT